MQTTNVYTKTMDDGSTTWRTTGVMMAKMECGTKN